MSVVHHITVVKYPNGCSKIIPNLGLVADVKFQFPGLHARLTWISDLQSKP
jgi:hypothetical protein